MNFVYELQRGAELLYREVGRHPKQVFVPVWRFRELHDAIDELFPKCPFYPGPPSGCDFIVSCLRGHWWTRDYIEYRL